DAFRRQADPPRDSDEEVVGCQVPNVIDSGGTEEALAYRAAAVGGLVVERLEQIAAQVLNPAWMKELQHRFRLTGRRGLEICLDDLVLPARRPRERRHRYHQQTGEQTPGASTGRLQFESHAYLRPRVQTNCAGLSMPVEP